MKEVLLGNLGVKEVLLGNPGLKEVLLGNLQHQHQHFINKIHNFTILSCPFIAWLIEAGRD